MYIMQNITVSLVLNFYGSFFLCYYGISVGETQMLNDDRW
uniref:Uncharacterized protein n=1 Tax=Arundo donax TaxID=35708 RepID=A0A0A9F1L0_ARUDO